MKQQLHKRVTDEQARIFLENYLAKEISSKELMKRLEVGKTRFFKILKKYRENPKKFTLKYPSKKNNPPRKISDHAEKKIIKELKNDKKLIENKNIPVNCYNYSMIRDTLEQNHGIEVSVATISKRAHDNGYFVAKKPKKIHDRVVLTNFVGELVQHDSSFHQFSPYMNKKLYLITSLDDHSRLMLFADLFEKETSWKHIFSLRKAIVQYGAPLKYYADQHSIFRFVRDRDKNSAWVNNQKFTDDVVTQFKRVLLECGSDTTYALSPQAKGKIERPYRWIQDRLVRVASKEKITNIEQLRKRLQELIQLYNCKWMHSTTKEVPIIRFERAVRERKSLFNSLQLAEDEDLNDIFCLQTQRFANAYRKISLCGLELDVSGANPRDEIQINIVPDLERGFTQLRFWRHDTFLGSQKIGINDLRGVHF